MPVTIDTLGQRVLRRLGLSLVPGAERDTLGAVVTLSEVARQALQVVGVNQAPTTANVGSVAQNDLALRVLRRLGVVASDELPTADDLAVATDKVRDANQMASAMGVGSWTLDAIPEYAAEQIELMAANLAAATYGRSGDPALNATLLAEMRAMALGGTRGQQIAERKAAQAFAMVVSAGVADWASDMTPGYMAPALVQLTANLLAPVYGKEAASPDAILASMRRTLMAGPRGLEFATEKVRDVHAHLTAQHKTRWLLVDLPREAEEPYVMMASALMAPIAGVNVNPNDWAMGERMITQINVVPYAGEPMRPDYF